jgi:hypothetical protein
LSSENAPPDEPEPGPPPRMFGPVYWTAIAFAVLCILGGLVIAKFGPVWLAPATDHPTATESLGERPDSR